jgi:putative NADH-flavin reductase
MKVLVLGATGATGREVLAQALGAGHDVTVLVRDPARLGKPDPRLRVLSGGVEDADKLADAVRGQDAVISTLGVGSAFRSKGLFARGMPLIVKAMQAAGVRRFVLMSSCGVGETMAQAACLQQAFMRLFLREVFADKAAGEEILRRSDLDWTIAYPVALTHGPKSGRYRSGEQLELRGFPTISRADVADFLLRQLTDPTYRRKGALLSGA